MPRPICVDCQIEMVPLKNSFIVELMTEEGGYQKFSADKWGCPNCSFEMITGFGKAPVTERWKPDYASWKADLQSWPTLKEKQKQEVQA